LLLVLFVLGAVWTTIALTPDHTANTNVTPNTAFTDKVDQQAENTRVLALGLSTAERSMESSPTPPPTPVSSPTVMVQSTPVSLPPPTPTYEALAIPEGKVNAAAGVPPLVGATTGQTIAGVRIAYYTCDYEGFCGRAASGTYLEKGERFAACGPGWPFGTRMSIVGDPNEYVWDCRDRGSAVDDMTWDLWFDEIKEAREYWRQLGVTIVTIQVFPP
jgi:3D (Asp-Asp-Asp) domain-containing protein